MNQSVPGVTIQRREVGWFAFALIKKAFRLLFLAVFKPRDIETYADQFASLYSNLWDYAEHSISNRNFHLPSALGDGPVQAVSGRLANLYCATYACLSFSGSSGAALVLLTAVLPKLQTRRKIVLFDEMCHQSTIGGLIFGRWKSVKIPRSFDLTHGTSRPVTCRTIIECVEAYGAENVAAIVLVLPSYDGFRSQTEEVKIYNYAKSQGIYLFIDGAWDATAFRRVSDEIYSPTLLCDAWITSPHKRGLSPSSLGCMVTNNRKIARLWDEALDLGFRSSSVSFVDIMIAEHRLQCVANGSWDASFAQADDAAREIAARISEVHPDIYSVKPEQVGAETSDPAHILISTSRIPQLDARNWAFHLSETFGLDVEKATATSLLLLCGSPSHGDASDKTLSMLRDALRMTLASTKSSQ
jgi:hypothetical protein